MLGLEDAEASMEPLDSRIESGSGLLGFDCCIYDICASD
jgi:hypothetical protein